MATADVKRVIYRTNFVHESKEFTAAEIDKPILSKNLSGSPESKILIWEQLHCRALLLITYAISTSHAVFLAGTHACYTTNNKFDC